MTYNVFGGTLNLTLSVYPYIRMGSHIYTQHSVYCSPDSSAECRTEPCQPIRAESRLYAAIVYTRRRYSLLLITYFIVTGKVRVEG